MNINDRDVLFKFIHEYLPNNKRLYNIGHRLSPNCDICEVEETNVHMFLYCFKVQDCLRLLYRVIFYLCNINAQGIMLKCLFFDFPKVDVKIRNTLNIIMSTYISVIWYNRDVAENFYYTKQKFKEKLLYQQNLHKLALNDRIFDIFTVNYSELDRDIFNNL